MVSDSGGSAVELSPLESGTAPDLAVLVVFVLTSVPFSVVFLSYTFDMVTYST